MVRNEPSAKSKKKIKKNPRLIRNVERINLGLLIDALKHQGTIF